jgi:putative transposase
MDNELFVEHPHTPPHLFKPSSIYFVTGTTALKKPFLAVDLAKENFQNTLFTRSRLLGWQLEAWAILDNHYHFMASAPTDASTLTRLIRVVHSSSANFINKLDKVQGRRVWYNYWDSCITNETSYLARLHYVNMNPVKHGLVEKSEDYPFSSYRWFVETAETKFQKMVFSQPIDHINVHNNF